MSGRICSREGCGNPLPPQKPGPPRMWCSDKCRKQASFNRHAGPCVDCGAEKAYSGDYSTRCWPCEREARRRAHVARAEDIVAMWAEGKLLREIAAEMGWGSPQSASVQISQLRAEGYDLPNRNRGSSEANRKRWAERKLADA